MISNEALEAMRSILWVETLIDDQDAIAAAFQAVIDAERERCAGGANEHYTEMVRLGNCARAESDFVGMDRLHARARSASLIEAAIRGTTNEV